MTPELTILIFSVILHFIWIIVAATRAIKEFGLKFQAGPRDNPQTEPSLFLARAKRLCANSQENLVIFGFFIIIAHLADVHNELTIFGAQLYFFTRVIHGIFYLTGWPHVRPLAWFVSIIGIALIPIALFMTV